jgi:hypothetical protein
MFPGLGQPGLSQAMLLMVTVLQFRHNLSDRQAAAAVADRISWKYACAMWRVHSRVDCLVRLLRAWAA